MAGARPGGKRLSGWRPHRGAMGAGPPDPVKFNLRLSEEDYAATGKAARAEGLSLNQWIFRAISAALKKHRKA